MDDFKLSDHFSFFELTTTSNTDLQESNRLEALKYRPTLEALCRRLLDPIRGDKPLVVNSGFRSWTLNGQTPGSSPTSQHPQGQAADIHRPGQDVDAFFAEVLALLLDKRIPFGQLIDEQAERPYGVVRWVHVSLGPDFWKPERCGEVMKMVAGPNGKPQYTMLQKVQF